MSFDLNLFASMLLLWWLLEKYRCPVPEPSPEERARVNLVLLVLFYLEAHEPKLEYYLPKEVRSMAGGAFGIWFGSDLEELLRHMAEWGLIKRRISQREQARTMDSDTPMEYALTPAGNHTLQHGPPRSFRPPSSPPPRPPNAA